MKQNLNSVTTLYDSLKKLIAKPKQKDARGFSLPEMMMGLAISSIAMVLVSNSMIDIARNSSNVDASMAFDTYSSDLRSYLGGKDTRDRNNVGGRLQSYCFAELVPRLVTNVDGNELLKISANAVLGPNDPAKATKLAAKVELLDVNLIDLAHTTYAGKKITKTVLNNFYMVTERTAFGQTTAKEVPYSILADSQFIIRIVQGDIFVEYIDDDAKQIKKITRAVPINFAFKMKKVGANFEYDDLLDCGTRQLSNAISHIEACKSLGADFEFVYDNYDNSNLGKGQCYAPIYEPQYARSGQTIFTPNGKTAMLPSAYTPLRYVFCALLGQGKSYTFPYCLEVK